jgi:ribose 1,5-bisphosphokinase
MKADCSRRGVMIAVVGPSGAGKDSLLNFARARYRDDPDIGFVQRLVTRPADGATEDHVPITPEEFHTKESQGAFAVSWGAHGLRYGIPIETVAEVAAGRILLANGSRAALDRFHAAYPDLAVLEITARPEVIAARLAGRGRESAQEIEKRLARDAGDWRPDCRHIRIDNSGALDDAASRLFEAIEALRHNGS